jgi:flavodoxin I
LARKKFYNLEGAMMKNVTVIYWSGSGNTQAMAEAVGKGAMADDIAVRVLSVKEATIANVIDADAVALGCPAMGNEVLEEDEMEPFIESLEAEADLQGKPLALFGSYDWGDGQWMRDWIDRMDRQGARLVAEGLIVQNTPDEAGLNRCRELGAALLAEVSAK